MDAIAPLVAAASRRILNVDPTELTCAGGHNDVARYLAAHGWATLEVSDSYVNATGT